MFLLYALARPIFSNTAPSESMENSTLFDPVTGECDDINGCRTAGQILWNCLSVIFICTWVAIHPNVPHVKAHRAVVLLCNGMLMILAMLAPEIIILWAIRQRYSAKEIADKYKEYGWGMAHGFLVIMGGFALYDGDEFCEYLWNNGNILKESHEEVTRSNIQEHHEMLREATAKVDKKKKAEEAENSWSESDQTTLMKNHEHEEVNTKNPAPFHDNAMFLEYLIENGYIPITEDEIMDNLSHSDSITKIIAVIQTAWFLLQVGARAMEGLAITELEIITVGFAVLNFGTYFLWWNKPVQVEHPVRVYWRQQTKARKRDETDRTDKQMSKFRTVVVGVRNSIQTAFTKFGTSMVVIFNFLKDPLNSDHDDSKFNDDHIPDLFQLVGLPCWLVFRLIGASICIIFDNSDTADYMAFVVGSSRLEDDPLTVYIVVYGLTTLFGAIHCIPWNFEFSTHTERLLWRISAGGLVVLPLTLVVLIAMWKLITSIDDILRSRIDKNSWAFGIMQGISVVSIGLPAFVIAVALPFAYILARVNLMALALIELRILPPSAYQTVGWTTFIPHIG